MKTPLFLAAMALAAGLSAAQAAPPLDDQTFVKEAANGGMFEVQSSQVALEKAKGAKVKDFAQMMIKDHTAANDKLKGIAASEKLAVPDSLDAQHQGDLDQLRKSKGPFDPAYVSMQRKAHSEAVMLFENYAKSGKDPALKQFATETLPTLKMHRKKIGAIAKSEKSG